MTDNYLLKLAWTFSFKPRVAYKQQSERDWLSDYKTIYDIDDIEKFWRVYNNIPCFTEMPHGSIYAMFKNNIHPSWEHIENKKGFSWILYIPKNTTQEWTKQIYENILLMLIGATYRYESMLNGCTFEKKARGDKIVFWFKDKDDDSPSNMLVELMGQLEIGNQEFKVCSEETKIDWKLPDFRGINTAIKMVKHDTNATQKTQKTQKTQNNRTYKNSSKGGRGGRNRNSSSRQHGKSLYRSSRRKY